MTGFGGVRTNKLVFDFQVPRGIWLGKDENVKKKYLLIDGNSFTLRRRRKDILGASLIDIIKLINRIVGEVSRQKC